MKFASIRQKGEAIARNKFKFFLTFFVVFTLSYGVLYALDWVPEEKGEEAVKAAATSTTNETVGATEESQFTEPLPIIIRVPKLEREVPVLNPDSRAVADLDQALLEGVVRHPDSADLLEEGNVFILGHSSYLPKVFNRNFQAFNGIQNLVWGDIIEIETADGIYTYEVQKVYKAKVSSMTVPLAVEGHMLTLATCDSFGSTEDRFIVEAERIEVQRKLDEGTSA